MPRGAEEILRLAFVIQAFEVHAGNLAACDFPNVGAVRGGPATIWAAARLPHLQALICRGLVLFLVRRFLCSGHGVSTFPRMTFVPFWISAFMV